ncbi:MAG: TonB-dependent receptor [Acidobacteria bacterium]|nr:TonB-dependent receptor [Acidobacteriota bacterium]MBS1864486.1 TonB-dependent receptor [Acidobacteriota bacterium]
MKTRSLVVFFSLLSILFLPFRASAQADRGAIRGETQDTQKGSIAGAELSLKNTATGVVATSTSGAAGDFNFLNLAPGVYSLTVQAKGFATSTQERLVVEVGKTISLVVTLSPGEIKDTVTVSANAAAVDTQTSDIGTSITPQEIKDLPVPLSGDSRNPLSFVLLTPGVAGSTPGATPDYRLHISGGISYSNEVYIDGIPVSGTALAGDVSQNHPSLESIGEFKMVNNSQNAQYGFSNGLVSFTFKSGTNQYHGTLYDYLQNDALNATGFVGNATGQKKAPLKQNEYGGNFGGPVWIPKLYEGKNKTFFFVDYTGFKFRPSSNNASLTTFPNKFRAGDFSQILGPQLTVNGSAVTDAAGNPIFTGEIYNPFSVHTVTGPDGNQYQVRDSYANNIIPTSAFSAVSQKILPSFPTASNDGLFNNFLRVQSSKVDEHRVVIKLDEHISERQTIAGSAFWGGYLNGNNGSLNALDSAITDAPTKQFRVTHNYTFSPTLVNSLNVGFLRDTNLAGPQQAGPGLAALGIMGLPPLGGSSSFPHIGISSITGIGGTQGSIVAENRYIVNDNLVKIHGRHSFNIGGELRRLQRNEGGLPVGNWVFEATQTAQNGTGFINGNQAVSIPAGTGNPFASFLLGGSDFSRIDYPVMQYQRWLQTGVYFQDDWRVSSNLTLNLGIRYDIQVPRTEAKGNVSTLDPTLPNPAAGNLPGAFTYYGNGPGRNGKARIGDTSYTGFQPRIGFAYSPGTHRMSYRGSFAVNRPVGNDNLVNGIGGGLYDSGFAGLATLNRPGDAIGSAAYYWDNPYPASAITGANLDPGALVGNTNPPWVRPSSGIPPTQFFWTGQVQRQLNSTMLLSVGYVGMHAYHMGVWSKPNQIDPALAKQFSAAAAAGGLPLNEFLALPITDPRAAAAGINAPWPGFVSTFGPAATIGQALRPFPQFGNIDNVENPIGSVSYNGLQTSLQKRFSNGLTFLVAYTFSKTIGDVDSNIGWQAGAENAVFAGSFFQDYYNGKAQRSVTSSDIPHNLSISYTYELPFGPGKKMLNHGGVVGKIVGGWQTSGILHYQSGRPIHIEYDAFGSSNPYHASDGFSFRPDVVPGQPLKNPAYDPNCSGPILAPGRAACQFYINPAAFKAPAQGDFGNAPNFFSGLRMPRFLNEDLSISKRIPLYERVNLQFQANFFNAFNRVVFGSGGAPTFIYNFAPPDLSAGSLQGSNTPFGIMTSQQNGPRIIQFGLKLEF